MSDDLLLPAEMAPLLVGTIFGDVRLWHHFPSIDSTNRIAMQDAAAGAPEGSVYIAEEQSAGRGRGGHSWHSAAGTGIYLSLVLRPQLHPADVLWLSLTAGIAAQDAVFSVTGLRPDLRWPNDLLLGPKKMGGILSEVSSDSKKVNFAVVGIGLNVNQSGFPPEIADLATSLRRETDRVWSRLDLACALLQSIDSEYQALRVSASSGARRSLITRFEERSSYVKGAHVEVHEGGGPQLRYTGITQGLDEQGFLRIKTGTGVRTLISGGIRKF